MKLWVVGKIKSEDNYNEWDFQGVFDTALKAESACQDRLWFVGPVELNEELPAETFEWPESYYPIS